MENPQLKNLLDLFYNSIKLLIPTVIGISLVYESMYFLGLGTSIAKTPLGVNDYLKSWVEWSVPIFFLCIGFFAAPTKHRMLISKSMDSRRYQWEYMRSLSLVVGIAFIAIYMLFGEWYLLFAMMGCSSLSIYIFLSYVIKRNGSTNMLWFAILVLPIMVISIGFTGYAQGKLVLQEISPANSISINLDGQEQSVIRIFDQWTLIKISKGHLGWVRHDSDRLIEFHVNSEPFNGYAPQASIYMSFDRNKLNAHDK
ncbi:hypothetical protein ICN11_05980 [Polynucleobacter sp. 78F-HAINBA]|uniref:hypothetical protein n=1 Tax=Polynucleobacter sp. 78F-HAINBA TaxID=2689099 RepID=UPI001C0BD8F9|nr:hypothetical protein [Polynucleobacter sp. 78F-HAINBA]MBU3591557.1 hypothetical protein [Polynucleobacter sp. 78F-HAINBA]